MRFMVELAQPDVEADGPLEAVVRVREAVRGDSVDGFVVTATEGEQNGRVWTVLPDGIVLDGAPDADPDLFTVLGTYDDAECSRFAFIVPAESAGAAERKVQDKRKREDPWLNVAAVVRGRCEVVA